MTDSNECVPIITSTTRTKDPKRVEAGKRLAAISKAAKERKMRERVISEKEDSFNYGYVIGTIGVFIAAGSLYYTTRQDKQIVTVEPVTVESKNVTIKPSRKLDSLD